MLVYIKERVGCHPLAEEKQLLDCLKVVLDNGWTVCTEELIQLFDMLELSQKVKVKEEYTDFLQFLYLLGIMLKVDTASIENYFHFDKQREETNFFSQMNDSFERA